MANRNLGCLSIFLFLALMGSVTLNFVLGIGLLSRFGRTGGIHVKTPPFREIVIEEGTGFGGGKIALITLRGLISSSISGQVNDSMVDDLRSALRQAREDSTVKAVVLEIDSPGGEVTAADNIYHAVVQTRREKPVVIYMGSVAASGGYYIACGGTHLIANETSITGSIGVIIQTLNYERLFEKIGLGAVVFKSGRFKDTLSGARPMTPEEREYIQNFVMKTYDRFVGIVASERELPVEALRNTVADGRILSGKDALEHRLIDGTGQIEDAFAKARELGNAPDAAVVKYGAPFALGRFFQTLGKPGEMKLSLLPEHLTSQLETGRAYLLPSFYAP